MAKYENSSHIQSAEAIVQIIKSVQVLLADAGVPLELCLFHNGEPLNIKEMPPHSANTPSPQLLALVAILKASATVSTTAVLKVLYAEFPQLLA